MFLCVVSRVLRCGRRVPAGVCLVCIDLVVVVDVWVGECMGIWVSGFLVPSHYLLSAICYLLSGIWYLVHFCLSLPGTSTLTCFYLPLLLPLASTLTPGHWSCLVGGL